MSEKKIPVLTDMVAGPGEPADSATVAMTEEDLQELQARIASRGYALMEGLLHDALREMEANLFAEVIGRLRGELPGLIEEVVQEQFGGRFDLERGSSRRSIVIRER